MSNQRRYIVKAVTASPAWTGTLWAIGCTHLASAEATFTRKAHEASQSGAAVLLIDRVEKRLLKWMGTSDPLLTARTFGEQVLSC